MQTFNEAQIPSTVVRVLHQARNATDDLSRFALSLVLLVYVALTVLFAVITPAWQNPDEPAHYNYIAHIAEGRGLPYLQMGDYDGAYIDRLTTEKFPSTLSIEPLRYEFHQPPLYYLITAPIFWLSGGSLLALRLFSASLGGAVIVLIFLSVRQTFPARPMIAVGTAAFAAFLPMHVAMMASINNDSLAELIIAVTLYALLSWLNREEGQPARDDSLRPMNRIQHLLNSSTAPLLMIGLLVGLGFLTKATTYVLLPVVLLTVFGFSWQCWGWRRGLINAALVLPWALLLGMTLWLRNLYLYGGYDFLGLNWHDRVVTGQPTTVDWIATNGWGSYLDRAWEFTFSSFWGVFGWMAVFMDSRIYLGLLIFSGTVAFGLLPLAMRSKSWFPRLRADQRWSLFALFLLLLSVAASYVWYNLGFVQQQGRYLFPALLPLSLLVALGWRALLRPPLSLACALLLFVALLLKTGLDVLAGDVMLWSVLLLGAAIVVLLANAALALRMQRWHEPHPAIYAIPFVSLALLDVAVPFLYIFPQLR